MLALPIERRRGAGVHHHIAGSVRLGPVLGEPAHDGLVDPHGAGAQVDAGPLQRHHLAGPGPGEGPPFHLVGDRLGVVLQEVGHDQVNLLDRERVGRILLVGGAGDLGGRVRLQRAVDHGQVERLAQHRHIVVDRLPAEVGPLRQNLQEIAVLEPADRPIAQRRAFLGGAGGPEPDRAAVAGAGLVLAELYRGADDEATELAFAFDTARTRGLSCERAYDSLSGFAIP